MHLVLKQANGWNQQEEKELVTTINSIKGVTTYVCNLFRPGGNKNFQQKKMDVKSTHMQDVGMSVCQILWCTEQQRRAMGVRECGHVEKSRNHT